MIKKFSRNHQSVMVIGGGGGGGGGVEVWNVHQCISNDGNICLHWNFTQFTEKVETCWPWRALRFRNRYIRCTINRKLTDHTNVNDPWWFISIRCQKSNWPFPTECCVIWSKSTILFKCYENFHLLTTDGLKQRTHMGRKISHKIISRIWTN